MNTKETKKVNGTLNRDILVRLNYDVMLDAAQTSALNYILSLMLYISISWITFPPCLESRIFTQIMAKVVGAMQKC